MSTNQKTPILDHLKWNYPFSLAKAEEKNAIARRVKSLINTLTAAGLELEEIEQDLELEIQPKQDSSVNDDLKKYSRPIAFIVGHSNQSRGAYSTHLQVSEYNFWRNNIDVIKQYLMERYGIPSVIFHRNQGTKKAYQEADKHNPLFTCELHFNSSPDKEVNGFETLALLNSSKAIKIAQLFNENYKKLTPIKMRRQSTKGVKEIYYSAIPNTSRGLYNLSQSKHPSILTEPFFGSNEYDCKTFELNIFTQALAQAYITYAEELAK